MRCLWLLLAAGLLLITGAAAQPLLEDPSGDVEADHYGQSRTPMGAGWESMDLLALDVDETPQGFAIAVTTAGLFTNDPGRVDQGSYRVYFEHDGAHYMVRLAQTTDNGAPFASVHAIREPGDMWGPQLSQLDVSLDEAAARIATEVPRALLTDAEGRPPQRGDALGGLYVVASAHRTNIYSTLPGGIEGGPATIGDRMPDTGDTVLDVRLGGGTSSGPVDLDVTPPFRVSNGEATTYRMDATVHNLDAEARTFRFMDSGLRPGWELRVGGRELRVEGSASATFPLFLTVPFAHAHGEVVDFEVHVHRSDDEGIRASEHVGVHYHAIPQPAGHHDTLYFHSRVWSQAAEVINPFFGSTNGVLSMTTIEEAEDDARQPIRGFADFGEQRVDQWAVCLEPALLMGLDLDLPKEGELTVPLAATVPIDGTLEAELLWVGPGPDPDWCTPYGFRDREQRPLGHVGPVPVSIAAGGTATATGPFTAAPSADRVERTDGADLVLMLTLRSGNPGTGGTGGVDLAPGGWLRLPLLEYHDALPALPDGNNTEDDPDDVFIDGEAQGKDSPAGLLSLVAVLGVAVGRRVSRARP